MSRIALYRKYRPNNFKEIFGQDHIRKILENSLKEVHFSHAYIFFGPRGVGKTSVARILAKGINCLDLKSGNPCNVCTACTAINEQRALDIIEIDAASNRGIDEIRDLREKVKFAPSELKYKVFIIDEVHMLTKEAFNALLKTLEEPPEHVVFILATTEIHKIPATVISRCQRFDFRRIAEDKLFDRLKEIAQKEKINIDDQALAFIGTAVDGGLRDGISILDQISLNSDKGQKIQAQEVHSLLGMIDGSLIEEVVVFMETGAKKEAIEKVNELVERGGDVFQITRALMDNYRKKLVKTLDSDDAGQFIYAIEVFSDCNQHFKYAVYPQLSLEIAILKIIDYSEKGVSERPIVAEVKQNGPKRNNKQVEASAGSSERGLDQEKWPEILFEIKGMNNSIHAFVREADANFEEDSVRLVFPYRFHKERIEDRRNREVVEKAIAKICGGSYQVVCELDGNSTSSKKPKLKSTEQKPAQKNEMTPFDILGGEIVE